jgi:pimeloyl-ACP methyl ester carboxylesterase
LHSSHGGEPALAFDYRNGTMLLSDGRRVGCQEVGRADGFPVIHCHGNGSSRLEVMLLADLASAAGVRLIGLDRPGIGDSDPAPGRTLIDWPDDVAQVADRLRLGRFAIVGVSAGGAYALACARRMPDRLTGCALVSSMCPPELILESAPAWMRAGWWIARHCPALAHAGMRAALPDALSGEAGAQTRLLRIASLLARPDRDVLHRPEVRKALVRSMLESRRQGPQANRSEILALLDDWNLPIEQIALRRIFLWHGGRDRMVPVAPARLLADRLPHCSAVFYADEGHFSTLANHAQEVLAALGG